MFLLQLKNISKKLAECNTVVDFIPPGYTSKLQILDIGINKPFKNHLRNAYEEFMMEQEQKEQRKQEEAVKRAELERQKKEARAAARAAKRNK